MRCVHRAGKGKARGWRVCIGCCRGQGGGLGCAAHSLQAVFSAGQQSGHSSPSLYLGFWPDLQNPSLPKQLQRLSCEEERQAGSCVSDMVGSQTECGDRER